MRGFNCTAHMVWTSLILEVHLERVNQRGFAYAEYRVQRFSGPRRRRTGLFYFFFLPSAAGGAPVKKDAGVMWYFLARFSI